MGRYQDIGRYREQLACEVGVGDPALEVGRQVEAEVGIAAVLARAIEEAGADGGQHRRVDRRGRLEAGQGRRVGDGPAVAHHRQRRAAHLGIGLGIGLGLGIGIGMGMRIGIRIGLGLALGFAHRAVHALGGAI